VVASELLDEVGINAFNMRLLAERLNTSTTTLYRHVAGKEELCPTP
jgi:AcrR family transcriptional regulator